jgi:hypothetical protein
MGLKRKNLIMKKLTIAFGLLELAFGALIIHHSQDIIITVLGVATILLSILTLKHSNQ